MNERDIEWAAAVILLCTFSVVSVAQEPTRPSVEWTVDADLAWDDYFFRSITASEDDGFVAAWQVRDVDCCSILVTRHDSAGRELWRREVSGHRGGTTQIHSVDSGNFLLTGHEGVEDETGDIIYDVGLFTEIDADGTIVWSGMYRDPIGTVETLRPSTLRVLSNGDYLLTGNAGRSGGFVARFAPRSEESSWWARTPHAVDFAVPLPNGEIAGFMNFSEGGPRYEQQVTLLADGTVVGFGESSPGHDQMRGQKGGLVLPSGSVVALCRFPFGDLDGWRVLSFEPDESHLMSPVILQRREGDFESLVSGAAGSMWAVGTTHCSCGVPGEEQAPVLVRVEVVRSAWHLSRFDYPELRPQHPESWFRLMGREAIRTSRGDLVAPFLRSAGAASVLGFVRWHLPAPTSAFRRGDANTDGDVSITDAVTTLLGLFQGGPAPACADGADADDDGRLTLTDAIVTLNWLFLSGPALPAPGAECGVDPSEDDLPSCSAACAR